MYKGVTTKLILSQYNCLTVDRDKVGYHLSTSYQNAYNRDFLNSVNN